MTARHPRAALAMVIAEGLLGRLTFGMVSFAFPLYALSLGLSLAEIGLLVSLRSILALSLKPGAGWLVDRIGIRPVYVLGAFARVLAAVALLSGGAVGLVSARLLQGASAAGRDVASLGVIARDARARVGVAYGWYATARHVGGVAGAGAAGLVIAAAGGTFEGLFALVLVLSVLPMAAAWFGLREISDGRAPADVVPDQRDEPPERQVWDDRRRSPIAAARRTGVVAVARELAGPSSVGMLVATSAYMVHGLFPVLATQYAGLTEVEAGLIYSLSAAVFLVAGPTFGWLIDRHGQRIGIGWRAGANIGSSLLYLLSPTFVGLAFARVIDDSGKAAFRPAWASAVAAIAESDPPRRGRRLGLLDASQHVGEALGPALAGVLWQSGGIVALFGVRIVIAALAELAALRVFGEIDAHQRSGSGDNPPSIERRNLQLSHHENLMIKRGDTSHDFQR